MRYIYYTNRSTYLTMVPNGKHWQISLDGKITQLSDSKVTEWIDKGIFIEICPNIMKLYHELNLTVRKGA